VSSQGPFTAGTVVGTGIVTGSSGSWSDPSGAEGSGSSPYAQWSTTAGSDGIYSPGLIFTGWNGGAGFSVPTGATIVGFIASVTRSANNSSSKENAIDHDAVAFFDTEGTTLLGSNLASSALWPPSLETVSYGSSAVWQGWTSPTVVQVNDPVNFGFGLAVQTGGSSITSTLVATVESCTMELYYTLAASAVQQQLGLLGIGCSFAVAVEIARNFVFCQRGRPGGARVDGTRMSCAQLLAAWRRHRRHKVQVFI